MHLIIKYRTPKQNLALSYGYHIRTIKSIQSRARSQYSHGNLTKEQVDIINGICINALKQLEQDYEKSKKELEKVRD